MTATSNLEKDHIHILKLCDVMEKIISGGELNAAHLEKIISSIRNYADGLHHKKEEEFLFPLMSEKGFPMKGGPIAVMLNDHEAGRAYVRGMDSSLSAYKSGDSKARDAVFANMQGYVDLLRSHISKENNVLFRMADNAISSEEQKALLAEFEKVDAMGSVSDYITSIDGLSVIYGTE